jgi:hypothetical protein
LFFHQLSSHPHRDRYRYRYRNWITDWKQPTKQLIKIATGSAVSKSNPIWLMVRSFPVKHFVTDI